MKRVLICSAVCSLIFKLDQIPEKLKEAAKIEDHLKKIISQNNLEPPSSGKLHLDQ